MALKKSSLQWSQWTIINQNVGNKNGHLKYCFNDRSTSAIYQSEPELIYTLTENKKQLKLYSYCVIQESPAIADKPARCGAKNCSNSTCLQRCRWQYWPIFMRLAAVASEICEIPRNSLKIQIYQVQGHPRSSILVPIESPYVTC